MNFFKNLVSSSSNLSDIAKKNVEEILTMSPNDLKEDFFSNPDPMYQQELAAANLSEDQRNAIQLVIDAKNKQVIFEKCYKGKERKSIVPGSQNRDPYAHYNNAPQLAGPQLAGPQLAGPQLAGPQLAGPQLPVQQTGGRGRKSKRTRKSKRSKKSKKSKKSKRSKKRKTRKN